MKREPSTRTARLWCALILAGSGCNNGATASKAGNAAAATGPGGTSSTAGSAGNGASGGAASTSGGAGGNTLATAGQAGTASDSGAGGRAMMAAGGSVQTTASDAGSGAGMNGVAGSSGAQAGAGGVQSGAAGGPFGGTSGASGAAASSLGFDPVALVITGVRGVASPVATTSATLRNGGASAIAVQSLGLTGNDAGLFQITSPPTFPASVAAGETLTFTLALLTASSALPAAPPQNSGATLLSANLVVTLGASSFEQGVSGLVLTTDTHEPTLGQILDTLGYVLDVGAAQNNANPNTGGADMLPGIEANTDEVAAPLFQKAGAGDVTLNVAARFSPKGPLPFGWYPPGSPDMRNVVGTMAEMTDAQTSDKARMVLPPVTNATSFDPGTASFGVWVYTDQLSQKYDTGGTASNGDYDYSEDAPNSPPNTHRFKAYPLKDASGPVPNSFLLAVEEGTNGDYQDYVFVLGNAKVAGQ
jgi:hypothetical protein